MPIPDFIKDHFNFVGASANRSPAPAFPPPVPPPLPQAPVSVNEDDLVDFVNRLGFQHGYGGRSVDYLLFARIVAAHFAHLCLTTADLGGLEARYVGEHRRGFERAKEDRAYALQHGAARGPARPDLGIGINL